jgi:hypothetical protein
MRRITKGDRDLQMVGCLLAGMTGLDKAHHPAPQIRRVGLGHRSSPPTNGKMTEARSRHAAYLNNSVKNAVALTNLAGKAVRKRTRAFELP